MHKSKETIYQISGIVILISAVLYLFAPLVAPWIMAVSVLIFSGVTALSPYPGKSVRGKRLFNLNNLWALSMMIGAVFLLYSGVMISRELHKERSMGGNE